MRACVEIVYLLGWTKSTAIFGEAITPTQPTISSKINLPDVPTRVAPCITPEPYPRVGTLPCGPDIIPPNNEPTGPNFIAQEEEETYTMPLPRQYTTRNQNAPQNYKTLALNNTLNSEFNLSNHITQIQEQTNQLIPPLNPPPSHTYRQDLLTQSTTQKPDNP